MKTWLTKWRISHALDERKALSPAVERALAESAELRRFAADAAAVDQAFTQARPQPTDAPSLHTAILGAIRSAEPATSFRWQDIWPRLIPATTLAILIIMSVCLASRSVHPTQQVAKFDAAASLGTASYALEMSGNLMCSIPDTALSPLSEEILMLNRDLTNAQDFLLASLP